MNHPVILAVPVLMLLDYTFTILGAKLSRGVYRQHFKAPQYEMNPIWQKNVAKQRWVNPRHLILVCLISLALVYLDSRPDLPIEPLKVTVGALLGTYGAVCGRHFTNLLLFWNLERNPNEITGQVELTHRLSLKISLFNMLGLLPLLGLLVMVAPDMYVIGTFLGVLVSAFVHLIWLHKAKGQEAGTQKADEGGSGEASE
jgi:hypothetical protein